MAVLKWKWVHNGGLGGDHFSLCQFGSASGECLKVVGVLTEVVEHIISASNPPLPVSRRVLPPLTVSRTLLPSGFGHLLVPSQVLASGGSSRNEGLRILSLGKIPDFPRTHTLIRKTEAGLEGCLQSLYCKRSWKRSAKLTTLIK